MFLSAHILLWEILNLNLTTMLECRGRNGTRQKSFTSFLKMVISFCLSFPNAYLAFQCGGFLPREWLATKSLFNRFFLATHDWSPPPPSPTLHTKCMHNFASVSILHRVGEGELKGICKKMHCFIRDWRNKNNVTWSLRGQITHKSCPYKQSR